jgi:hypothetical protein
LSLFKSLSNNILLKNKETALHLAASSGKMEIIKLLNEHKIDLHAQDNVIKLNS